MKVTDPLLVTSFRNTKCRIEEFLHLVNITSKQWNKYIQTGKLKVSPTTYKKLTILAKDSPVTQKMYWQACTNWNRYWEQKSGSLKYPFVDLLETPQYRLFDPIGDDPVYLPPQAARMVELLASPHYVTIIKMLEAKKLLRRTP